MIIYSMSSIDSGSVQGYTSGTDDDYIIDSSSVTDTDNSGSVQGHISGTDDDSIFDSLANTDNSGSLQGLTPGTDDYYTIDSSSVSDTDNSGSLQGLTSGTDDDGNLIGSPDSHMSSVTEPPVNEESDLIQQFDTFGIKNKSVEPLEHKKLIEGAKKISDELELEKNPDDIYKLQDKGIPKEDVTAIYDVATLYKRMHDIDLMSETSNMSGILIDMAMELEDSLDLTELESITDSRKFNEKMIELLTKMNIKTALNTYDNKIIEKKHLRDELGISSYITDNKETKKNTKKDSEQIQMQSIWGIKLTEDSKSPPFICYLCGEEIINKWQKNIGMSSEMEHKKPAPIVFGKYPHYDTLKNYSLKTNYENDSQADSQETGIYSLNYTQNLIELWKDFKRMVPVCLYFKAHRI